MNKKIIKMIMTDLMKKNTSKISYNHFNVVDNLGD